MSTYGAVKRRPSLRAGSTAKKPTSACSPRTASTDNAAFSNRISSTSTLSSPPSARARSTETPPASPVTASRCARIGLPRLMAARSQPCGASARTRASDGSGMRASLAGAADGGMSCSRWRSLPHPSLAVVLVVATPPEAGLVATEWRAVEPLVHAPEAVQPARVRRVGVVDDAILERERAHARPLAPVRLPVRSDDAGCEVVEPGTVRTGRAEVRRAEVGLDRSRIPLLLGVRRVEVVVEVAVEGGRPGEAPAHPPLVCLQLRERGSRHRAERDVVIREVDDGAVEAVRDRRAARAPCCVVRAEHEVIDEQLRASGEEIREGRCAGVGVEAVFLVDSNPGQLLALPRQFVATSRQRLFGVEQLQPGG